MNTKIHISTLLLGFIIVFVHSCSNDFLTEGWSYFETQMIYVLPDEDAKPCLIAWQGAGNATFTITKKPYWLKVESMNGQFVNDVAELTCSVIRNDFFTEPKIYVGIMTIEVDGVGKVYVEVGYNNGMPGYPSSPWFHWEYYDFIYFGTSQNQQSVRIANPSNSILTWKVIECPEWINMKMQDFVYPSWSKEMTINCNRSGLPEGSYEGAIIFSTNDKNKPTYTVNVFCQVGN